MREQDKRSTDLIIPVPWPRRHTVQGSMVRRVSRRVKPKRSFQDDCIVHVWQFHNIWNGRLSDEMHNLRLYHKPELLVITGNDRDFWEHPPVLLEFTEETGVFWEHPPLFWYACPMNGTPSNPEISSEGPETLAALFPKVVVVLIGVVTLWCISS